MPILQDEDYVQIPKTWLYELLADSQPSHVFMADIRSKISQSDFTPKKIRIELGRLLAAIDKDREFFVVHIYEDTKHAEIWTKHEWTNSISARLKLMADSTTAREDFALANERYIAIANWLETNMHLTKGSYPSQKLTAAFAKLTVLPAELAIFPGLKEILEQYGNLNKSVKPS